MKLLVTGGGGFLAAWIVRRLRETDPETEIRVFDSSADRTRMQTIAGEAASGIEWVRGDVADGAQVADALAGCTHVIHLAGLLTPACQDDPVRGAAVNVVGTINVFEAAIRHGMGHVIYTSSVSVYGLEDGHIPEPDTHYGAFKLANEGNARTYWAHKGIGSVGFRVGVVYGPGRDVGLSAGSTLACRAAARGEDYTIGYTGPTCLVYVEDVAAAYVEALTNPPTGARVIDVPGSPVTVEAIIEEIGRHNPSVTIDAAGNLLPFTAEIPDSDLFACFPDLPRTPLSEGIARTIAYYRAVSPGAA